MSLVPVAEIDPSQGVYAQLRALKLARDARMKAAARAAVQAKTPELEFAARRTWDEVRREAEEEQRIKDAIAAKVRWRQSWVRMIRLAYSLNDPHASMFRIITEVSFKYGFTVPEIKSPQRNVPLTQARHEICWRAKLETGLSLPLIGKLLGGRDHTTVLNGVKKYERLRRVKQGLEKTRAYDRLIDWEKVIVP